MGENLHIKLAREARTGPRNHFHIRITITKLISGDVILGLRSCLPFELEKIASMIWLLELSSLFT